MNHRNRGSGEDAVELADRLHSVAIHLLRRLRREDEAAGITGPELSALSVVAFGGAVTIGELAAAEGVRPPTISRLVSRLEAANLVTRERDATDRRSVRVRATARGLEMMEEGRRRRVATLAAQLQELDKGERTDLERATSIIELLLRNDNDSATR